MSVLEDFLNEKPLYYDVIDYDRMPRIYKKIKENFKIPKIVHLIGTNGKGTTGRFLASALRSLGHSTGHYTSPHIVNFNERIWINSEEISDEELDKAHRELLEMLSERDATALSYFEYTTLLAMQTFQGLDYVVMEAGLGGEYDATAVFPKTLTLVTPIDFDHQAFLGSTIKEIASTKLNAITNNAIIAKQIHKEVKEATDFLVLKKSLNVSQIEDFLDDLDLKKIARVAKKQSLVPYMVENLKLSVSALKFLRLNYSESDFDDSKLFGRLTPFGKNTLLDVGHNLLAAKAILNALKETKYVLVYNSYIDKNYKEILKLLKPIIKRVEIIDVGQARIVPKETLIETLIDLGLEHRDFDVVDDSQEYLVFGSFSVVEEFLRTFNE